MLPLHCAKGVENEFKKLIPGRTYHIACMSHKRVVQFDREFEDRRMSHALVLELAISTFSKNRVLF